jgi:hypothetical protein
MRTPIDSVEHGPQEELWYGLDWGALGWLPEGDTISTAAWTVADDAGAEDPITLLVNDDSIENTTETWVRLTGGTSGVDYIVSCLATTSSGEVGQRSLLVQCR